MTRNFQQKLISSFLLIFAVCTFGIVIFEQQRMLQHKKEALQEKLNAYVEVIAKYISTEHESMNALLALLPGNLRVTLIDSKNNILYDNVLSDYSALESYAERPEIIAAMNSGSGSALRNSVSNNIAYLYYAKKNRR